VAGLETPSFVLHDDAGPITVEAADARTDLTSPVALTFLLDTGGAMAPHVDNARGILKQVIAELGPNDVVRIVKFNEGSDEQGTNWVRRDDPNLAAQVDGWQATSHLSLVVPALRHADAVAAQAPDGYERRATVALLSVDGDRGEPGLNLESVASLATVTFAFGFGTPPKDFEGLPFFLEDLAVQRNGAYWPVDSVRYQGNGPALLRDAMHSVWDLTFLAEGLPDGKSQQFTMEVRDPLQRSGAVSGAYSAGTLFDVSPPDIAGLRDRDEVDDDREITVALGGEKRWDSWRIELFRDCRPDTCTPIAEATDGVLHWRLVAGPLDQGDHEVHVRIFARSGSREFTDTSVLRFTRSGTGWNFWTPTAIFGFALAATVPILALARRARGTSSTKGVGPPIRKAIAPHDLLK
jgi:hypothetical protein